MGFLIFLSVIALGVIVWLLWRIDAKLGAIGNMLHAASQSEDEEPKSLPRT